MDKSLANKKIAVLVANGFTELHFTSPQRALIEQGAALKLISPEQGLVNGWHETSWGHYFPIDESIADVLGADYDALLVPGGHRSVIKLSQTAHTGRIVKSFMDAAKPVVALGEGVSVLAMAERANTRNIACPEDLRTQMTEAGAVIEDDNLIEDGNLLTGYGELDITDLTAMILRKFAGEKAKSDMQTAA